VKLSEDEIKSVVTDIKQKMISGEIDCDIAICIKQTGSGSVVEGRNAESFGMGDKFTDANGDEVEVLRVIDRNMTVILDQKMVERSNQLKVGLEKKFYISFGDAGKVKHGLVQLESSGVKVLPRYQDKIGCEFIKHAELLKLQPSVNGGSVAAGMVREMINLYRTNLIKAYLNFIRWQLNKWLEQRNKLNRCRNKIETSIGLHQGFDLTRSL